MWKFYYTISNENYKYLNVELSKTRILNETKICSMRLNFDSFFKLM